MHCIVLFGNEEFAGAGVIKTILLCQREDSLNAFSIYSSWAAESLEVFGEASWKACES